MTGGVMDSFGGNFGGDRSARVTSVVAHLFPPVAVAVLIVITVNDALGGPLPNWVAWAGAGVYAAVIVSALFHERGENLCVRCMRDVPADAPARAARRRWLLWAAHHASHIAVLYSGLAIAAWLITDATGWGAWPSPLYVPTDLAVSVLVISTWTHHRLRPWCPYCRPWDDGGPREPSPTPDPHGVKIG